MKANLVPKEAFQLIEKVYGDVASPGLQVVGKAIADTLKLIALPFSFAGLTSHKLLEKYEDFIKDTLNKIPKEKLMAPEPIVAAKLLEDVKFVFDNPVLYEMFSNLLASSMNIDTKDKIHTSFVNILSQMDTVDAKVFYKIHKEIIFPICNLYFKAEDTVGKKVFSRLCTFEEISPVKLSVSIVNLIRLGLLEVNIDNTLDDNMFENILTCDVYTRIVLIYDRVKKTDENFRNYNIFVEKGTCSFTTLGEILSQYIF